MAINSETRCALLGQARLIAQRTTFYADKDEYLQLPAAYQGPEDVHQIRACFLGTLLLSALELGLVNGPPDRGIYFPRELKGEQYYALQHEPLLGQLQRLGFSRHWLVKMELRFLAPLTTGETHQLRLLQMLDEASGLQGRTRRVPGHAYSLN